MKFSPQDNDLSLIHWHIDSLGYVARKVRINGKRVWIRAHRIVLSRILGREIQPNEFTDHLNGDRADNRRENLRLATRTDNRRNLHSSKSRSGLIGVWRENKLWRARIQRMEGGNKITLWSGCFDSRSAAVIAFNQAALRFGLLTRNPIPASSQEQDNAGQ